MPTKFGIPSEKPVYRIVDGVPQEIAPIDRSTLFRMVVISSHNLRYILEDFTCWCPGFMADAERAGIILTIDENRDSYGIPYRSIVALGPLETLTALRLRWINHLTLVTVCFHYRDGERRMRVVPNLLSKMQRTRALRDLFPHVASFSNWALVHQLDEMAKQPFVVIDNFRSTERYWVHCMHEHDAVLARLMI